jgi:flavin reductase (DIM6/NTAB) family NADH-FMN oxidoreductase RutF
MKQTGSYLKNSNMVLLYNPRQMVLVSCRGRTIIVGRMAERDYVVPTTWHSPCCQEPAMYLVIIPKSQEQAIAVIRDEGRFIVNFLGKELEDAVVKLSSHEMAFDDPFKASGLTKAEGVMVPCPRVMEAVGWAECELNRDVETDDHIIFIGRILHADLPHKEAKRLFHVEGDKFTTTQ